MQSERALREIYGKYYALLSYNYNIWYVDCLDCHNNKQALLLSNKLLKKSPGLPLALAFKALASGRLGKYVEARDILQSLFPEAHLFSETVLLYVSLACKAIGESKYRNHLHI